jgi:hypothetical protein
MVSHAIEGQVVLMAGAKASVSMHRLSELLERFQEHLDDERDQYDRRFERIDGGDVVYFLVPESHIEDVGAGMGLTGRETDAIRRSHRAQFKREGRRLGRLEEFEAALEIRDVVAVPAGGQ